MTEAGRWPSRTSGRIVFGLVWCFLVIAGGVALAQSASAAPTSSPSVITYQGKLLINNLAATTTQNVIFLLYDSASTTGSNNIIYTASGTIASPQAVSSTPTNGLFSIDLGGSGTNALDPGIFQVDQTMYLEVRVGTETLSPRRQITAAPYAYNARFLDGVMATTTASSSTYIPISDSSGNFIFNAVSTTGSFFTTGTLRSLGGTAGMGISVSSTSATNTVTSYFTSASKGNALVFDTSQAVVAGGWPPVDATQLYSFRNGGSEVLAITASGSLFIPNNQGISFADRDTTRPLLAQFSFSNSQNTQVNNSTSTGNIQIQNLNDTGSIQFITGSATTTRATIDSTGILALRYGFISGASSTVTSSLHINGSLNASSTLYVGGLASFSNAVMASGTTGNTPGSGPGVRFMWIPSKYALRAGEVTAGQWNDGNIAAHSVAFGKDVLAIGQYGIAVGSSSTASGLASVALGTSVEASGSGAVALGNGTTATGTASVALGWNSAARNDYAIALGPSLSIKGLNSVGINLNTTVRTIDNANVMVVMGGNVGIGTLTPAYTLDVSGPLRVTSSSTFEVGFISSASSTIASSLHVNDRFFASSTLMISGGVSGGVTVSTTATSTTFTSFAAGTAPRAFILDTSSRLAYSSSTYLLSVRNLGESAFSISSDGFVSASATVAANVSIASIGDVAEYINLVPGEETEPGDVIVVDLASHNKYRKSTAAYAKEVAGVISNSGAFVIGARGHNRAPVALAGLVHVKVSDEGGPINVGDYLVTAPTPGHAMKYDPNSGKPAGLIGMALEPHTTLGFGQIKMMINKGLALGAPAGTPTLNVTANEQGQLVQTGDLDLAGNALLNVKSIASKSGQWSIDEQGNLRAKTVQAEIVITKKLCVDSVCVTEQELRELLQKNGMIAPATATDTTTTPMPTTEAVTSSEPTSAFLEPVSAEPVATEPAISNQPSSQPVAEASAETASAPLPAAEPPPPMPAPESAGQAEPVTSQTEPLPPTTP